MRKFEVMFMFIGWTDISLGVNLDTKAPRVEIHIPFGFIAVGWRKHSLGRPLNWRSLTNDHYLVGKRWYE